MERHCIRCGKPICGRADKKFCGDDCRSDYHNEIRRREEKQLRKVNCILSNNWRILAASMREGRSTLSVSELSARDFNFGLFTASSRRFPGKRYFWCYNYAYRISRSGKVHIISRPGP